MDVDEAWREYQAVGVDFSSGSTCDLPDRGNRLPSDGNSAV
jgi:hypothetical protein